MDPRCFLSSTPERSLPPPARWPGAPVRKEDRQPADRQNGRGPAYARAWTAHNLASGCDAGVPMSGKARDAVCCLSGTGAPPGRRGGDTRRLAAASSRQGHAWAARGLPTPCRREHSLHVSQSVSTGRAGGKVNARSCSGCGRACTKRLSALSIRGHAIGRWPRFEPWQGGWSRWRGRDRSVRSPGAPSPTKPPGEERLEFNRVAQAVHRVAQAANSVAQAQ
jgi:hypothetical protein